MAVLAYGKGTLRFWLKHDGEIVRILFTMGHAYFPQRGGGAQSNTDQLVKAIIGRGHVVAVACTLSGGGWTEKHSRIVRTITGKKFSRDRLAGYDVYRAWDPTDLTEVVRRFRPDVAVVQNGASIPMALSLQAMNVPTVLYFHNVEFDDLLGTPTVLKDVSFVSNSEFTSTRVYETFGVKSLVIRPFVPMDLYQTATNKSNVTFVNPYPEKGADIAFAVARGCPEIPFVFVESWGIDPALRVSIDRQLAKLPNVSLKLRTTDMREVYANARILLAPSRWEEAWGRVATEAQICGIPVIGSTQGGLPEAIGPGGITIDIDADISVWITAIRQLWNDDDIYQRFSSSALAFSQRPEMNPTYQTNEFIKLLSNAVCSSATD